MIPPAMDPPAMDPPAMDPPAMDPPAMDRDSVARERVRAAQVARLATITADGTPHIVPFCFAMIDGAIVSAVDGKPKSTLALRRLANIASHPAVSLVVDHYDNDWSQLWWVRVDGVARVVESGRERDQAIDALAAKYDQYRTSRPAGAVIVIKPTLWRSWEPR